MALVALQGWLVWTNVSPKIPMMNHDDRWWQLKYCWNFHPCLGLRFPFWRSYFSNGLEQTTRSCCFGFLNLDFLFWVVLQKRKKCIYRSRRSRRFRHLCSHHIPSWRSGVFRGACWGRSCGMVSSQSHWEKQATGTHEQWKKGAWLFRV